MNHNKVVVLKEEFKMVVSKIGSNQAFKGYIDIPVPVSKNEYERKKINVKDITNIEDEVRYCTISTPKEQFIYKYREHQFSDISDILHAYTAAKVGDSDFTVKL